MPRDVFISYRHEDRAAADQVCSALERRAITCWIAPRDITPGAEWATGIVEGIGRCHAFVVILSGHCKLSKQIARELELADSSGLSIIALRIEDVQPPADLKFFLGNVQWVDAFDGQFDAALARLSNAVTQNAGYPAEATRRPKSYALPFPPSSAKPPLARRFHILKVAAALVLTAGLGSGVYLEAQRIVANHEFDEGEVFYHEQHQLDAAISEFGKAIAANNKMYEAYCERASVYREKGDRNLALQDVERAIALKPQRFWARTLKQELLRAPERRPLVAFEDQASVGAPKSKTVR